MARSKHLNDRLTKAQEIFVQELLKGNTQRQAYLKAYPSEDYQVGFHTSTCLRRIERCDKLLK